MTDQKHLEARLLPGFLAAARNLGPELKTLSWFGRNHGSEMVRKREFDATSEKLAA